MYQLGPRILAGPLVNENEQRQQQRHLRNVHRTRALSGWSSHGRRRQQHVMTLSRDCVGVGGLTS